MSSYRDLSCWRICSCWSEVRLDDAVDEQLQRFWASVFGDFACSAIRRSGLVSLKQLWSRWAELCVAECPALNLWLFSTFWFAQTLRCERNMIRESWNFYHRNFRHYCNSMPNVNVLRRAVREILRFKVDVSTFGVMWMSDHHCCSVMLQINAADGKCCCELMLQCDSWLIL